MPGPLPKDPKTRQRRNRSSTAARLTEPDPKTVVVPPLPKPEEGKPGWHPLTLAWWKDIWHSPMASEFHSSDVHGLYLLATLVDAFWWEPNRELAAEIRQQRQCFGLTPMDRRRLQWEIERVEQAQAQGRRVAPVAPKRARKDPRQALVSVK